MKIEHAISAGHRGIADEGFTIVEAVIGMSVIGITSIALFSGLSTGYLSMQLARENLRATQIMLQKTELIRLYSWDQITAGGFVPTSFIDYYDPAATNANGVGLSYLGSIVIDNVPFTNEYSATMRQVTVNVTWHADTVPRTRSYTTYISQDGLQTYIY